MNNKKVIFLISLCLIYSILMNNFYRPFAYSHNLNDWGLADIGNNLFFIPGTYLAYRFFSKKYLISKYKDIWFSFIILSLFEIGSYFFPFLGTFDFTDILGLLLGAVLIHFYVKNESKKITF